MLKLQHYNKKNKVNLNSELKNLKNQAIKEGEPIMDGAVSTVYEDTIKLLSDIRHAIALLGGISMNIEVIMANTVMLTSEHDKERILKELFYNKDGSLKTGKHLDRTLSEYNSHMLELHEHIGELMEEQCYKL